MAADKRGSFTVEAAFLLPLFLGILVLVLYVGFYFYNEGMGLYVGAFASNQLVQGENAENWKEQWNTMSIGLETSGLVIDEKKSEVFVQVKGKQNIPFVKKTLSIDCEVIRTPLDQRSFILKCMMAQGLLK